MTPDPLSKVLPDKVRHLEARVARLEDTVGMLEKEQRRTVLGITSRESKVVLSTLVACTAIIVAMRFRETRSDSVL